MARRKRCAQCNSLFRPDPRIGVRQTTCSDPGCQHARHQQQSLAYHRRQSFEIYCDCLTARTEREVGGQLDESFYDRVAAARQGAAGSAQSPASGEGVVNENSSTYTTQGSPFLRDEFWMEWRVVLMASVHIAVAQVRDERLQESPVSERGSRSQRHPGVRDEMDMARSSA